MSNQIKRMDDLWAKVIKARAGYICEISNEKGEQVGGSYQLEAHHIHGKKNYALRYSLLSGICITDIQHTFYAHGDDGVLYKKFLKKVMELRGDDIVDKLQAIKNDRSQVDLDKIEQSLKLELKKYENN